MHRSAPAAAAPPVALLGSVGPRLKALGAPASRLRPDCIAATESAMMENAPRGPLLARPSLSFPPQGKRAILRSQPAGIAAVLRARLAQRKKLLDSRDDEEAEGTVAQDTWDTQP